MSLIFVPATATLRDTATLCARVRDRERDMEVAADVQLGSLKPQIMTQTEMAEVQVIYYLIWKKNNKKDCTKIKRTKGKAYTSMN
jgi:AMMECR1 domain-containing protein